MKQKEEEMDEVGEEKQGKKEEGRRKMRSRERKKGVQQQDGTSLIFSDL